ncbi:MAG: hypothetical protein ACKVX7_05365 [Planctomycetota bacterium]
MMRMRYYGLAFGIVVAVVAATLASGRVERARAGDGDEILYSKARIYIEYNDSAEDVGVQVLLDGEPWRALQAFRPDGKRILNLSTQRGLRLQGLTEFFFESSEPSLADVPLSVFLSRFPAGVYEFEGETVSGEEIEGEATFSHVIPTGPEIISPISIGDEPAVVDPENLVIEWEPVTTTIFGSPDNLQIVRYQVIVEQVDPPRHFQIDLPASTTSVTVPPEFLTQPGTLHKFEILAVDASGNQTITEGEFVTEM